jgi:ribokinase
VARRRNDPAAEERGRRQRPVVVVVGSLNMDLVSRVPRLPAPGETVIGGAPAEIPGGMGANQAVAAARLGAETHLVGRVGGDERGRRLLQGLRESGVAASSVGRAHNAPSGAALILVDRRGENSIAVAPGANHLLAPHHVEAAARLLRRASVVVLGLEVPLVTVERALALCRRHGVPTILDPAPVPPGGLPRALLAADVLTPNELEAEALLGKGSRAARDAERCRALLALGSGRGLLAVVLKLGRRGAMVLEAGGRPRRIPAFRVAAVDATAAGDAFTAGLAVALGEGRPLEEAARFACAAGALAATVRGAQPSLPSRRAEDLLFAAASL